MDRLQMTARDQIDDLRSRMGQLHGVATANGKVVLDGRMTFALGPAT